MIRKNGETRLKGFGNYFIIILVSSYFIMKPFYFWDSGLPQISDFLILFSFFLFFMRHGFVMRFPKNSRRMLSKSGIFLIYVVVINILWYIRLEMPSEELPKSAFFYVFNIGVMLYFVLLYGYYKESLIRAIYRGCLISVMVQVVVFMSMGGFQGGRNLGMFNNPNQLGYYGLLIFCLLIYTSQKIEVNSMAFMVGILSAVLLTMSSLSKAAIVSFSILIFGYIFSKNQNRDLKKKVNIAIILGVLFLFIASLYVPQIFGDNPLIGAVTGRVNDIGKDKDDTLEMRGYDRILNYPQYWFFGSGEGEYKRFDNATHEFHSTLGTIQVSYGIIGLLQFMGILYYILKKGKFKAWYIIASLLMYGLAHNGIRNSMLWMLIALYTMNPPNIEEPDAPKVKMRAGRKITPALEPMMAPQLWIVRNCKRLVSWQAGKVHLVIRNADKKKYRTLQRIPKRQY